LLSCDCISRGQSHVLSRNQAESCLILPNPFLPFWCTFLVHMMSFGKAQIFYSEVTNERCTVVLLVEVNPVGLVRNRRAHPVQEAHWSNASTTDPMRLAYFWKWFGGNQPADFSPISRHCVFLNVNHNEMLARKTR
jgi:hypothetical protein